MPESALDRDFLTIRGGILDLAAALDRLDRDPASSRQDPRRRAIEEALRLLRQVESERAAAVQQQFSLPYRLGWREEFGV